MKLLIALAVCLFASAIANDDWSDVQPLHVEPEVLYRPRVPHDIPLGRITNGQIAKAKQFPYQTGLKSYTTRGAFWCGGSLISDRWVLTAAHCTDGLSTGVDVYLGAWNRTDATEKNQQIIFVAAKNIFVHEQYDGKQIINDISLIKMPVSVEFNDYIQPIALPKKASSYDTYVGKTVTASGWGKISDSAKGATDMLRYIEAPIMSNSGCNTWFFGAVKNTNICIKTTGGFSTCNGDSGGPLTYNDGGKPILIGATSFGIKYGCEIGWPGVFTRITSYLDWIQEKSGIAY